MRGQPLSWGRLLPSWVLSLTRHKVSPTGNGKTLPDMPTAGGSQVHILVCHLSHREGLPQLVNSEAAEEATTVAKTLRLQRRPESPL